MTESRFTLKCISCGGLAALMPLDAAEVGKDFFENHADIHGPASLILNCHHCGDDHHVSAVRGGEGVRALIEHHLEQDI